MKKFNIRVPSTKGYCSLKQINENQWEVSQRFVKLLRKGSLYTGISFIGHRIVHLGETISGLVLTSIHRSADNRIVLTLDKR